MAKQRASLRGRGEEILLGQSRTVKPDSADAKVEAQVPENRSAASRAPGLADESVDHLPEEIDFLLDDPELEAALEEEALAGWPSPGIDDDTPPAMEHGSPVLEVDTAYPDAAFGVQDAVEPEDSALDSAVFKPPAPDMSDIVDGVLPPRPSPMYSEMVDEEIWPHDIQEPEHRVLPIELPDRKVTDEEKSKILAWLGEEWIQELENEIDDAYAEVRRTVASNENIVTECGNWLLRARDIVVRRDVAKMAQAEYYVEAARARVQRAMDSDAAAKKFQWWILLWGLLWFGGLLALLILLNQSWFQDAIDLPFLSNAPIEMETFLSTIVWGGIGGVVAVLYSLFKHVGHRDFDSHFSLSYIGKPFLGLIIGATVYMAFSLLIRALAIIPVTAEGTGEVALPTLAPGAMYLVAWIGGFKENRIFELMDRAVKQTFASGNGATPLG
jgi:hypothetical protein